MRLTFFAIASVTFGLIALIVAGAAYRADPPSYSTLKPVAIEGHVTRADFHYPRASVGMQHDGREWTVMLAAPSRMISRGATEDKLRVGKSLAAYGYASSGGGPQMRAERIVIEGQRITLR